jgi:hypothetical protein
MTELKERLAEAMRRHPAIRQAHIARACKISTASVADWISGKTKSMKPESARLAAKLFQCDQNWLGQGVGRPNWGLDVAQARAVQLVHPVRLVSQPQAQPSLFEWEELMSLKNLPAVFRVALKDASMAPDLLQGDELTIDTRMQAQPGDLVLARDDGGALYVGLYRVRRAGGPWALVPTNEAFEPLESARDGLVVVGVAVQETRNRRRAAP